MTNSVTRLATAALVAGGVAIPASALAQGARIAFEPVVTGLPAANLWNSSRSTAVMAPGPNDRYPGVPETPATATHDVRLSRGAMALYGGRVSVASPRRAWRIVMDGATGRGTLQARVIDTIVPDDGVTTLWATGASSRGDDLPLAVAQLGLHVERAIRHRRAAIAIGGGAMAQRLHTRSQTSYRGPSTGGATVVTYRYETAVDPAVQASAAIGPATGPLAGLRLALRSTHVLRAPDLANRYRNLGYGMDYPRRFRRWQWQPEVSLGYQLPLVSGSSLAR